MTASFDESDLWLNVCKGDVDAFNKLFKNHYASLCTAAFVLVKEKVIAEDIVQDVFLKIWSKRKELAHINNIGSYLYISVKNACYDLLKKAKTTDSIHNLEITDSSNSPFDFVRAKELNTQLQEAATGLPPQCREIFEQVYLDGKKYQTVADELGLSINTVKTQLKRALAKMRSVMEKYQ